MIRMLIYLAEIEVDIPCGRGWDDGSGDSRAVAYCHVEGVDDAGGDDDKTDNNAAEMYVHNAE